MILDFLIMRPDEVIDGMTEVELDKAEYIIGTIRCFHCGEIAAKVKIEKHSLVGVQRDERIQDA